MGTNVEDLQRERDDLVEQLKVADTIIAELSRETAWRAEIITLKTQLADMTLRANLLELELHAKAQRGSR